MYLCDSGHEEVCHEGMHCPACEGIEEERGKRLKLEDKVTELEEGEVTFKAIIEDRNDKIASLVEQVEALSS